MSSFIKLRYCQITVVFFQKFFSDFTDSNDSTGSNSQVTARKVGEVVTSAISVAASTLNYPIGKNRITYS